MQKISKRFTGDRAVRRRRWSVVLVVGVLVLAAVAACGRGAAGASEATTHVVLIENMRFSPPVIRVQKGDRIIFKNADLVPHTVTATVAHGFDSGALGNGVSWSLACERAGEIAYHCTFHPTMRGTITVVQPE